MANLDLNALEGFPAKIRQPLYDLAAEKLKPQEVAILFASQVLSDDEDDPEEVFDAVLCSNISAAKQFAAEKHHHLVELMVCLQKLPGPSGGWDGQGPFIGAESWSGIELLWSRMHSLGMYMNEEWNGRSYLLLPLQYYTVDYIGALAFYDLIDFMPGFDGPDPEAEFRSKSLCLSEAIDLWFRINHYAALLTKTTIPRFEFKLFCLWSFSRMGIEKSVSSNVEHVQRLQWAIPGAAVWINILGDRMIGWDDILTSEGNAAGSGDELWNGKHGFCLERWQLWKRQFGVISKLDALDDGTKRVAANAESQMFGIESNALAFKAEELNM